MFIDKVRGGYRNDDEQWAAGRFLVAALPNKRPPEWVARRDAIQARIFAEHPERPTWAWKDYLSTEEREAGYGEVLYHAPFTELRCFVKYVHMHQCGAWMMGNTELGNHKVHLSGTYGDDGLPKTLPRPVWERGVPLPEDLALMWAKGGGHNCAGAEGPLIRAWALKHQDALRAAGRAK